MKKQSYYFSFLMNLRVQIYQITLACIIFAELNTIIVSYKFWGADFKKVPVFLQQLSYKIYEFIL